MTAPSDEDLKRIYDQTTTVAVVGASNDPEKPAHRVPTYLKSQGFRVIPVNPRGGEIVGEQAVESLADLTEAPDVVDVFRPSEDTPEIAKQAVAAGAKVLWLQEGIHSDEAEQIARDGGLEYLSDICMKAQHER